MPKHVPYEQRAGTKFTSGADDGIHVYQDIHKRNGTVERRHVGTIGQSNDGARIYQFRGQRLATMSFVFYGVRCISLGTQEWQVVSRMADRIELVDIEMGVVWMTTVALAARHGELRATKNGHRFLINIGAFGCYDREWTLVRKARLA